MSDDTDTSQTVASRDAEGAQSVAASQLRAFIERIERMEEVRGTINEDISEVYSEAKGTGFDVPAMRVIVAMRRKDPAARQEAETILELYMAALGMV